MGRGTRGRRLTEIEFASRIARELAPVLTQDGYTVVFTKGSMEERVTNRRRAEIANRSRAALMLRLHADAATNSGSTIYYPTRAGVAKSGERGPPAEVLARTAPIARAFAAAFSRTLGSTLAFNGLRSDERTFIGSRQGALTGSIFARVPAVLVELVVLTNPSDERFASSAEGRRKLVSALAAGVRRAAPLRRN